jgi:hypothetical protein
MSAVTKALPVFDVRIRQSSASAGLAFFNRNTATSVVFIEFVVFQSATLP